MRVGCPSGCISLFFEYPNPWSWFLVFGVFPLVVLSASGGESFHSPRHGTWGLQLPGLCTRWVGSLECACACVCVLLCWVGSFIAISALFIVRVLLPRNVTSCVQPMLGVCVNLCFSGVYLVFRFGTWRHRGPGLSLQVRVSVPVIFTLMLVASPALTAAATRLGPSLAVFPLVWEEGALFPGESG